MKLLIVDDHPVLREGLAALLRQADPGMQPLQASSAEEAFALVDAQAQVSRAVILHDAHVRRQALIQNAILDKNVVIAEGAVVGVDKEHDRARGLTVSPGGITVVGKGQFVPA